jgi:type VI secretion system protein VasG
MLPAISTEFLTRMMDGGEISKVAVDVADGEFTYAFD